MKSHVNIIVLLVLLSALILSACGAAATEEMAPSLFIDQGGAAPMEAPAAVEEAQPPSQQDMAKQEGESSSGLPVGPIYNTGSDSPASTTHMIIKSAEIKLLVEDTDNAIDRATQVVGDVGGYIISSRVWYQPHVDGKSYKYATITIGVPVQQFERTLNRLRGLAIQVLDETASGEDVTDQFVDLQSQLTNLEATRERIKSFLADAKSVDEALRINAELTEIERQIEEIKGRMNYLDDRSSFSTITINFEPKLPELLPTPTPTAKPEDPWNPGKTYDKAKENLIHSYQGIVEFLIWLFVAILPIIAPPIFLVWLLWKLFTRKPNKPAQ